MSAGATLVGRPKRNPDQQIENTPASAGGRVVVIHLKGSPEFSAWLDDLNNSTHIAKATLVRLALAEYAKNHGHPAPPEM